MCNCSSVRNFTGLLCQLIEWTDTAGSRDVSSNVVRAVSVHRTLFVQRHYDPMPAAMHYLFAFFSEMDRRVHLLLFLEDVSTMRVLYHSENLFRAPEILGTDRFMYVQCASADLRLGAGIARDFNREFNVRPTLRKTYGTPVPMYTTCKSYHVYTMITKKSFWMKPTLHDMHEALKMLRMMCEQDNVQILAMPRIGCGLDHLRWIDVYDRILDVFDDMDIDIHVFDLPIKR